MNLPETYAAVCAKRPELAVFDKHRNVLTWADGQPAFRVGFVVRDSAGNVSEADCLRFIDDETAAALILARWVEALPVNYWIGHLHSKDHMPIRWQVCGITAQEIIESPNAPTPLEALAAYYLGDTT